MKAVVALIVSLVLGCVSIVALSQSSQISTENDSIIDKQDLNYYLYQAFGAGTAAKRLAVNHIGLISIENAGSYRVSNILRGYPAQQAGLRPGDKLLTVDGEPFHPLWSFNQADLAPRFTPRLQPHQLTFDRNGQQVSVEIIPVFENLFDSYQSATISSPQEIHSGNKVIGYLKIWGLSRATNDLVAYQRLIDSLAHCDGLIIDLRDSYGFPHAEHIDQFFPNRNSFFEVDGPLSEHWQSSRSNRPGHDYFGKAVVIIQNQQTRGGMELFAYQLAKLQRIVSLGASTAGKLGSYYQVNQAGDLAYQGASDSTIDGQLFESIGIAAEQAVVFGLDESTANDPQFEAAFTTLMGIM